MSKRKCKYIFYIDVFYPFTGIPDGNKFCGEIDLDQSTIVTAYTGRKGNWHKQSSHPETRNCYYEIGVIRHGGVIVIEITENQYLRLMYQVRYPPP